MTRSPEDAMDYPGRQHRLTRLIQDKRLEGFVLTHLPNIRYLCGFRGSAGVLLVANGMFTLFTDGRYREQAHSEVQGAKVIVPNPRHSVLDAAARALANSSIRTVAVESEHMSMAAEAKLTRSLRQQARIRPTAGLVEQLRILKEPAEVERIRAAVQLASGLFDKTVAAIRPGVPEQVVAAELEYAARMAGADSMSFDTIVAAGPRSALPHGRASMNPIPRHGFVVLDFGVILRDYCSDMTRTVYVGKPSREVRRLYQAVRDAQEAALEAVRPGQIVGQVDRAARSVLRRAGLARYFTHSTGHGVGLEIHEPPRIARGQQEVLKPGMVITIEPGAYVPGYGGVRIEDMVVVTTTSCEVLTPTTKELLAV